MVTIVMPCYNESDIIEAAVREWHSQVASRIPVAELVVVDDASTDGSGQILDRLAAELPGLRAVHAEINGGHGRALRLGFRHATQEFVFQTDSDRQHPAADFWKLWDLRADCDFVFGVRHRRADGAFRRCVTSVLRVTNFLLWGVWIRDANCPFKLMRRAPLEAVLARIPEDCFIPMVMVSLVARKLGFRVAEAAVSHLPRKGGTQSLRGMARWVRVGGLCLRQLLALRLSL